MTPRTHDRILFRCTDLGMAMMRRLPAELSHEWGIRLLASSVWQNLPKPKRHLLPAKDRFTVHVPGIGKLPHPIGLAAGFDKHAEAPFGFASLGLSFIELGTVTPRPQKGNPKPRLFRYPDQLALINRMGFNSHGSEVVLERLKALPDHRRTAPIGVNVGKNKDTDNEAACDDFTHGIQKFSEIADYFVVNLSSPNTPGLRHLANPDFVSELAQENRSLLNKIWLKLDPDTDRATFQTLIERILKEGFQGVILTNTHMVSRPQTGGQSGHPLSIMANARLEWAQEVHQGRLPMIASGGILSGNDIIERVSRGAAAVQIYSALIYRGPWAVHKLLQELEEEILQRGGQHLQDFFGTYY